jgi:hypothetical protein
MACLGKKRVGTGENRPGAIIEWAWEQRANVLLMELVVLIRNVPRYRGQDIKVYPAMRD